MHFMEIKMKTLFEALLRLYEFDGPALVTAQSQSIEGRSLDAQDARTFPYLP